ncbi:diaminopimelate epimerase [Oceanirhabdus sp. W0125-5]|uniref:diaminopimelate epimerase n=1 Tax=Oceanirhabdus sp. W0125-5 TaxID=2999116 RepID=UPI0022F2E542|nr:diaminopimelate epimerase [Oceanirhabdus sp. W0125-5]WBW94762.1 diaminopimelate epimerase [Oceanirhabdus sp. W0125-5]
MKINYIKCHGTGNIFYLIDETNEVVINESEKRDFSIKVCNKDKTADGILFIGKGNSGIAKMRIFNSDGSEAEMCGNGLRCAGRYAGEVFNLKEFKFDTLKENYFIKIKKSDISNLPNVEVEISNITTDINSIPINGFSKKNFNQKVAVLSKDMLYTAVSISNPHLVTITDTIEWDVMEEQGELIKKHHSVFPEGINLSFLKIINENEVFVRTYERGVGFTKSCGTGMMSSVLNYCLNKPELFGQRIKVYNDGGMVLITVKRDDEKLYSANFEGNASYIESGKIKYDSEVLTINKEKEYHDEEKAYLKLLEIKDMKLND